MLFRFSPAKSSQLSFELGFLKGSKQNKSRLLGERGFVLDGNPANPRSGKYIRVQEDKSAFSRFYPRSKNYIRAQEDISAFAD